MGVVELNLLSHKHLDAVRIFTMWCRKEGGVEVDLENIPKNDVKTFDLLCSGETIGVFQFESNTMQHLLREAKPTTLEELAKVYGSVCKIPPHAIGYTLLAYQTAYLKAHYPTEYLSALVYVYRHNESQKTTYKNELKKIVNL